ncbi:hypothetical protein ACFW1A_01110 [Kitasatospora sp. NPDC058965]|uniref:hypothetical protein n=1 Tax=Kitasatospora sp. NPDC058965 TaxID=3346682 RepID=UPI00368F5DED
MAHPHRDEAAKRLQKQYPELGIRIVHDPDPDGPPATLRTARLAWGAVAAGATHHLVLQDDVELCQGFAEAVHRAVVAGPVGPLSFFANWASRSGQMLRLAALSGAGWAPVLDEYVPAQALLLPAGLAAEFARYAQTLHFTVPDNQAMSAFLAAKQLNTYVSCPNLVEHADGAGSLLSHDVMFGVRSSVLYPRDVDVAAEAFDGGVVASRCVPHFESLAGYAVVFFQSERDGASAGSVAAHEILRDCDMSNAEIVEQFRACLGGQPQAEPAESGFGYPFIFQLWLTAFLLGVVAACVLGDSERAASDGGAAGGHPRDRFAPDPAVLERGLERPWASGALATLPAGTLRRFLPAEQLTVASARLLGLCTEALRAGFAAPARWPELLTFPERLAPARRS